MFLKNFTKKKHKKPQPQDGKLDPSKKRRHNQSLRPKIYWKRAPIKVTEWPR